jgi:hypothetical protein
MLKDKEQKIVQIGKQTLNTMYVKFVMRVSLMYHGICFVMDKRKSKW